MSNIEYYLQKEEESCQEPKRPDDHILSFIAEENFQDGESSQTEMVKSMDECESTNRILSEIIDMNVGVVNTELLQTKEMLDDKKAEKPLTTECPEIIQTSSNVDSTHSNKIANSKTINEILSDFCDDENELMTLSELSFSTKETSENSKTEIDSNQMQESKIKAGECLTEKTVEQIAENTAVELTAQGTKENYANESDKEEPNKGDVAQQEVEQTADSVNTLANTQSETEINTLEKTVETSIGNIENEAEEVMETLEETAKNSDIENENAVETVAEDMECTEIGPVENEFDLKDKEPNTTKTNVKEREDETSMETDDIDKYQKDNSNENADNCPKDRKSALPDDNRNIEEIPSSATIEVEQIVEEVNENFLEPKKKMKLNKKNFEEVLKVDPEESITSKELIVKEKVNDREHEDSINESPVEAHDGENSSSLENIIQDKEMGLKHSSKDLKVIKESHAKQQLTELSGPEKDIFEGSTNEEVDGGKEERINVKNVQTISRKHTNGEEPHSVLMTVDENKSKRDSLVDYDEENLENISNTIKSFANESSLSKINYINTKKSDSAQPKRVIMVKTASNVERVKRKLEEILDKSKGEEDAAIAELQKMKKEKTDILNAITNEMEKLKSMLVKGKQG